MSGKIAGEGITFDDVLLVPAHSSFVPRDAVTATRLTRNINLKIPLVSAPMDTVTESALAIALAQFGGIGIIHKNLSVEAQALEVQKVKRSENGIIVNPFTLPPKETVATARRVMAEQNISGIPIVEGKRLVGILTRRDLKFLEGSDLCIGDVMSKPPLVTAPPNTTLEEAEHILNEHKVEKLLLTDGNGKLEGLITMRDIDRMKQFPDACKDARGRLRVGAAVGVHDYERVDALIKNDVDVIAVDSAHGHSRNVIETVVAIRKRYDIDIIAGNIATPEAARDLVDAGADAVKVGIGPGAICTTRVISGVGVPQITAIIHTSRAADELGVPLIADGGIRHSGDITKALAAGASSVMMGSLFAGLDESPGQVVIYRGRQYKEYRGMGSLGAMIAGSTRYGQAGQQRDKLVPEGVEGRVPYRGPLGDFIYQLVGGLKAGMGYCGTETIEALRRDAVFLRVSPATQTENHPHDITITREAPNYTFEYQIEQ